MDRREVLKRVALIMGGAVSAPTVSAFLTGCESSKEASAELLTFTPDQFERISVIAEHIIPATDTPGAKDAGVPEFIDLMLHHCYAEEERNTFLSGLDKIETNAQEKNGDSFVGLSSEQQLSLLKDLQTEAMSQQGEDDAPSFIHTMRELTLLGYFTSEVGATQALDYVQVPGRYDGCIPLEADQKAWAT